MSPVQRRLAVVGAGISGLAAARELRRLGRGSPDGVEVIVYEASPRPGGKVLTSRISDVDVDLGAESLLVRGPEVEATLDELGLGASALRPATTQAAIWDGRRMVAIPQSVLGVPLHPLRRDTVRALGLAGSLRAALEPLLPHEPVQADGAVGELLKRRLGRRVVDRLVDPLLGGVYAGPAAPLSVGAVAPQILEAMREGGSLLRSLRRAAASGTRGNARSPFVSFEGGMGRLVEQLVEAVGSSALKTGTQVIRLDLSQDKPRVVADADPAMEFDAVLLAVPAPEAARLLQTHAAAVAALLRRLEYASVATVTLAYADDAVSRGLRGSGFLVRRRPRRVVTACTFLDRKWPHLRRTGRTVVRASVGSSGDEWALTLDDTTLVTSVHRELRDMIGVTRIPLEARIERWHGALPQYRQGHLAWRERVQRALVELDQPLELTGAAFDGVGLAACLSAGAGAAQRLWARLELATTRIGDVSEPGS